jgi:hypothetical protein
VQPAKVGQVFGVAELQVKRAHVAVAGVAILLGLLRGRLQTLRVAVGGDEDRPRPDGPEQLYELGRGELLAAAGLDRRRDAPVLGDVGRDLAVGQHQVADLGGQHQGRAQLVPRLVAVGVGAVGVPVLRLLAVEQAPARAGVGRKACGAPDAPKLERLALDEADLRPALPVDVVELVELAVGPASARKRPGRQPAGLLEVGQVSVASRCPCGTVGVSRIGDVRSLPAGAAQGTAPGVTDALRVVAQLSRPIARQLLGLVLAEHVGGRVAQLQQPATEGNQRVVDVARAGLLIEVGEGALDRFLDVGLVGRGHRMPAAGVSPMVGGW